MSRCSRSIFFSMVAVLFASFAFVACGSSGGGGGGGGACGTLSGYTATKAGVTFADVMPILQDMGTAATSSSCASATICHGDPPQDLTNGMHKTLSFLGDAATVKAALMMASVNAPSMMRIVPGHVDQSFLAYKISAASDLACLNRKCTGSTISSTPGMPCGNLMPTGAGLGMLTPDQRTTILDWIADGAM